MENINFYLQNEIKILNLIRKTEIKLQMILLVL